MMKSVFSSHHDELEAEKIALRRAQLRAASRAYYARKAEQKREHVRRRYKEDVDHRSLKTAAAFVREYVRRGIIAAPMTCTADGCRKKKPGPFHPDASWPLLFQWLCRACRRKTLSVGGEVWIRWPWPARFDDRRPGPGEIFPVNIVRPEIAEAPEIVIPASRPTTDLRSREELDAAQAEREAELEQKLKSMEDEFAWIDALNERIRSGKL